MAIREIRIQSWCSSEWRDRYILGSFDLSNEEVYVESGAGEWVQGVRVQGSHVEVHFLVLARSVGVVEWRWQNVPWRQRHHLYELEGRSGVVLVRLAYGGACDRPAVHVMYLSQAELLIYLGVAFGHVAHLWGLPTETVSDGVSRLGLSDVLEGTVS